MLRRFGTSSTTLVQKRFSSSVSSSGKVVLGVIERGVRSSDFSTTTMSDLISSTQGGSANTSRINSSQIPAGDILGLMDICAANVAQMHCIGTRRFGKDAYGNAATSVCTVAVDQTPFMKPVLNGDMVVVEGRAIHAGSSSVGVAVEVSRQQFPTRQRTVVCNSFFTMVAICDQLKKASVVPAIELSTERDVQLNKQYLKGLALAKMAPQARLQEVIRLSEKQQQNQHSSSSSSCAAINNSKSAQILAEAKRYDLKSIECEPNKTKSVKIPFAKTRTEANRVFFPQYLNMNYTIFGGELMRWMEAHALHCGRMFTNNRDVRSLGMFNVTFNDAVGVQDWVTLNAHVVYVHQTTMEVEVEIGVEREDKKLVTNRASFVLANFDEAGQLIDIPVGLDLSSECSKDWLGRYADARARYEIGRISRNQLENAFNMKK